MTIAATIPASATISIPSTLRAFDPRAMVHLHRSTFPRLREDQLQMFAWKYLIPISLVNIVVTGTLKVVF